MIKSTKLTNYNIKKIINCFCIDIDATKTSQLLGINRNTINRFYLLFRRAIYYQRINQLSEFNGGTVEFDESYLSWRGFSLGNPAPTSHLEQEEKEDFTVNSKEEEELKRNLCLESLREMVESIQN